jgi:hypothetical protein
MMYFGLILVILGLLFSVWGVIENKPIFKKIFATSFITIFVGSRTQKSCDGGDGWLSLGEVVHR